MSKKIKIKTVNPSGPNSDGTELLNYFFEEFGEGYNFYSPTSSGPINNQLITPENPSFSVSVPGNPNPFQITVTSFPVLTIQGNWSDTTSTVKDTPGSGTFQAQAGGSGTLDEEATAASAK